MQFGQEIPFIGLALKTRKQAPSLEHFVRTFEMCFTSFCALAWSADDGLLQMHDCIMSVFQSAWFGKKRFCYSPRARQAWEFVSSAKKQSVCCSDAKIAACGKRETSKLAKCMIPSLELYLTYRLKAHQTA